MEFFERMLARDSKHKQFCADERIVVAFSVF